MLTTQTAHVELYNPSNSGFKATEIKLWVSKSSGFSILGKGAPMLADANFPESRGLPVFDGAARPYAACHVRRLITTDPTEVVQGGQFWTHDGTSTGLIPVDWPGELGMGTGLLVRNFNKGGGLMVTFSWKEVAVP